MKEIASQLAVSRSAVSLWCRDLVLTDAQAKKLRLNSINAGHKGRLIGAATNKKRRLDEIEACKKSAATEIGLLSKRDLVILASALFWAEGAKTGSRFMFVNTDPDMIKIMYQFLVKVIQIQPNRIYLTVQINRVHEFRIKKVLDFWSVLLGLPYEQFTKPYYIDVVPKKKYENFDEYYGVARLGVRGGASLQYRILGYINALKSGM